MLTREQFDQIDSALCTALRDGKMNATACSNVQAARFTLQSAFATTTRVEDLSVEAFLSEVRAELNRARTKFPGDRIMTIALAEEFGELCKAVLDEKASNVRKEAVQTAVMCARVVLDGDSSVTDWRRERGLDQLVDHGACIACQGRGYFVNRDLEDEWQVNCNGCHGTGRAAR